MSGGTHTPDGDTRTDEQLLADHTRGDPAAFSTLISRHHSHLWNVAVRTTKDPDDAADALQEALLSAHRTAHTFREEARVSSWLHRIVVNASLDRLRRNAARHTVPLPDFDTAVLADRTDEFQRVDLTESIRRALDVLPAGQRAAVIALDIEGYSVSEAAELLGVPEGTIKSRSSRGRLRLAALLGHLRNESLLDEPE
ncbi:RNA polymerase sigma factor SigM [Gordonia sp. DT30]|uniref:RNA polymerase sigma factor SigM n=1 Tax=unclassified Gordonia (in: high G+C Gram-positive bacteria) TaxID=2657482 RepID=UPI003CEB3FA9